MKHVEATRTNSLLVRKKQANSHAQLKLQRLVGASAEREDVKVKAEQNQEIMHGEILKLKDELDAAEDAQRADMEKLSADMEAARDNYMKSEASSIEERKLGVQEAFDQTILKRSGENLANAGLSLHHAETKLAAVSKPLPEAVEASYKVNREYVDAKRELAIAESALTKSLSSEDEAWIGILNNRSTAQDPVLDAKQQLAQGSALLNAGKENKDFTQKLWADEAKVVDAVKDKEYFQSQFSPLLSQINEAKANLNKTVGAMKFSQEQRADAMQLLSEAQNRRTDALKDLPLVQNRLLELRKAKLEAQADFDRRAPERKRASDLTKELQDMVDKAMVQVKEKESIYIRKLSIFKDATSTHDQASQVANMLQTNIDHARAEIPNQIEKFVHNQARVDQLHKEFLTLEEQKALYATRLKDAEKVVAARKSMSEETESMVLRKTSEWDSRVRADKEEDENAKEAMLEATKAVEKLKQENQTLTAKLSRYVRKAASSEGIEKSGEERLADAEKALAEAKPAVENAQKLVTEAHLHVVKAQGEKRATEELLVALNNAEKTAKNTTQQGNFRLSESLSELQLANQTINAANDAVKVTEAKLQDAQEWLEKLKSEYEKNLDNVSPEEKQAALEYDAAEVASSIAEKAEAAASEAWIATRGPEAAMKSYRQKSVDVFDQANATLFHVQEELGNAEKEFKKANATLEEARLDLETKIESSVAVERVEQAAKKEFETAQEAFVAHNIKTFGTYVDEAKIDKDKIRETLDATRTQLAVAKLKADATTKLIKGKNGHLVDLRKMLKVAQEESVEQQNRLMRIEAMQENTNEGDHPNQDPSTVVTTLDGAAEY